MDQDSSYHVRIIENHISLVTLKALRALRNKKNTFMKHTPIQTDNSQFSDF